MPVSCPINNISFAEVTLSRDRDKEIGRKAHAPQGLQVP